MKACRLCGRRSFGKAWYCPSCRMARDRVFRDRWNEQRRGKPAPKRGRRPALDLTAAEIDRIFAAHQAWLRYQRKVAA